MIRPKHEKIPSLDVDPEAVTMDDLITAADNAMVWYAFYAIHTVPIETVIEAARSYFSKMDGVEYQLHGSVNIMGPMPIPGFGEGVPVVVPVTLVAPDLDSPDHLVTFSIQYQEGNGYKFELQRVVEGTSNFIGRLARVFDEDHFAIALRYANNSGVNLLTHITKEGTSQAYQQRSRSTFEELERQEVDIHEITPYQGLQLLHFMTATVLHNPQAEAVDQMFLTEERAAAARRD